ncbi:uncharacterized protein PHA67_015015 isoform 1-T1 [Liasis olivaceus]
MFAMYALVPKVEEEEEEEENRRRRRRRVCVTEWKRKSLLGTFAKAESGCLSLLSRLGPVPRAAEEPETPLPLQLAGVSKEWKLVRRKDYLAKIWRSLLKSGFWKSLWSKLQQLIGLIPFIPKSFLVFGEMTRNIAVHLSLPKIDLPVGWGRFGDPLQATTDHTTNHRQFKAAWKSLTSGRAIILGISLDSHDRQQGSQKQLSLVLCDLQEIRRGGAP